MIQSTSMAADIARISGSSRPQRPVVSIQDPRQAQLHVGRVLGPHRLGIRKGFGLNLYEAPLDAITILAMEYLGRPTVTTATEHYMLSLIVRGGLTTTANGTQISAGPGEWVMSPPSESSQLDFPGDTTLFGIRIPCDELTRRLGLLSGRPVYEPPQFAPGIASSTGRGIVTGGLRQALLVADRSHSPAALNREVADALLTAVLLGIPGSHTEDLFNPVPPVAMRAAREAAAIIREQWAECPSIEQLAARVGVSARQLQSAFRSHYGTTPTHYLRDVRLDHAHAMLREAGSATTVAEVAVAAGFFHLGRFSATYRARFGADPSSVLRQGRATRLQLK